MRTTIKSKSALFVIFVFSSPPSFPNDALQHSMNISSKWGSSKWSVMNYTQTHTQTLLYIPFKGPYHMETVSLNDQPILDQPAKR